MVKWTSDEIEWCSCNKLKEAEEKAVKWDAIVRCGECKWREHETRLGIFGEYEMDFCWHSGRGVKPDGFCERGERRDA